MKCPQCDAFVKSSAKKCPNCSAKLPVAGKSPRRRTKADTKTGKKSTDRGKGKRSSSKIIDKRGEGELSLSTKKEEEVYEEKKPKKSNMAVLFLILAGIAAFVSGLLGLMITSEDFFRSVWGDSNLVPMVNMILVGMFIYGMVVSPTLFVAAYFAHKRKKWSLCILLALIGATSIGQLALASILALIGLGYLVASRHEFEDFEKLDVQKSSVSGRI